jgi:hypothetical protein
MLVARRKDYFSRSTSGLLLGISLSWSEHRRLPQSRAEKRTACRLNGSSAGSLCDLDL